MNHYEFQFASADGLRIACARWAPIHTVKGIVQIAHGLGEHSGRYGELVEHLVGEGLVVYANDHRGHGHTALTAESFGEFGPGGFDLLVEDMVQLSTIAQEEYPETPFILLGHSMGSFAVQKYLLDHSESVDCQGKVESSAFEQSRTFR
jgi:alpha-beta hydrolase superfamily lysophospholipase